MQLLTIAGTVGKDATLRTIESSGDKVLSFSLAVDNGKNKQGEKRDATWFDCSVWGDRARALEPHIRKGVKLTLSGRPSARAHEGKAYLGITVDGLTFQGGGERQSDAAEPRRGGGGAEPQRSYDLNDDIPFVTAHGAI